MDTFIVNIAKKAQRDIDADEDYLAEQVGRAQARTIVNRLYDQIQDLEVMPGRYKPRQGKRQIRHMPVEDRWVIVYRVKGGTVTVLRVYRAGQNY